MSTRLRDPLLGWSAVAGVLVTLAVLIIPHDFLPEKASAAEVTDFFTTNYMIQQSQPLMHAVGAVLLLVFFVRLATVVNYQLGERAAALVRAAGCAITAMIVVTMGWVAAVVTLTGQVEGNLQEALYTIGWDWHFRLIYLLPILVIPTGIGFRRAGMSVTGWLSLVLGAGATVAPLGYLGRDSWFVQYPVFMLFLVWALGTGIAVGFRGVPRTQA